MPCTVSVSPASLELEGISSRDLLAIASDCPPGGAFAWSSNNPAVATVTAKPAPNDYQATAQAVAAGSAVRTVTYGGASATAAVQVIARNFVLVFGDQGKGEHNLGKLPELAARTHESEIRANKAPGVPAFTAIDNITVSHVSTVSELIAKLNVGNVIYWAYFGHSWNENGSVGALFIGQNHAADTNLTVGQDPAGQIQTCTSPATLPKSAFRSGAVVRLFGCRGAFGADSVAEQISKALGATVTVFGFDNSGGSIFTNDEKLGHGLRAATGKDLKAGVSANKPIWMVPSDGTPHFRAF
jgi:hypothetical protein